MRDTPIDPERWRRLESVFEVARLLEGDARETYLDEACAGDADLRQRVMDLLREDDSGGETLRDGVRGAVGSALGAASGVSSEAHEDLPASGTDAGVDAGLRGTHVGPYRLEEVIGRGGMGTVWRASRDDEAYRKDVAIKMMHRGLHDPALRARFAAERQILASLDHPDIARLIDGGTSDSGTPYVVMELVEGRPIDRYCDARRLGVAARLSLFRRVCEAVAFAHRHLVVHRDLKPANILVTATGDPRLLDFGIAKALEDSEVPGAAAATATGLRLLTPEYASPEQVRGAPITTASDVYALGVILYELLTGRRPYRGTGGDRMALERAICAQDPERPSTAVSREPEAGTTTSPDLRTAEELGRARDGSPALLRRRLHGDLDNICLKALRKAPAERYASVDRLAEDIRRHLDGLPVAARPATLRYRAGKFAGRHRSGIAATAAVTLLMVTLIAFYTTRLSRERRRAEAEARGNAAVSEFLVDLFRSADPVATRGADVTAREILDRGAQRIEARLSVDPRIRERLMHTMARAYVNLSDLERGLALTDAALALEDRTGGGDPAGRAGLLRLRGTTLTGLARYDEARESLGMAMRLAQEFYGPLHEEIVSIRNALAQVAQKEGRYPEAESGYQESLRLAAALPGAPETLAAADTFNRLGSLYIALGRHEDAIRELTECVRLRRLLLDQDDMQMAACLSLLGEAHREKGEFDAAEPLLVEDLRLSRKVLGDDSLGTAEAARRLGNLYKLRSEPERALPLLEEALATDRRILGDRHPEIAQVLNDLANVLQDLGRLEESITMQRQALETATATLAPDHPTIADNLTNLAAKLGELGRYDEAETLYQRTLALDRKTLGERHPYIAMDLCNLAGLYMSMRRYAEAERLLRQALALQDGNPDVNPGNLATTLRSLGNLLVLDGRAAAGEPYLRRAVEVRSGVAAADSVPLATDRNLLGRALLDLRRLQEARDLMEPSYEILRARLPAGQRTLRRATARMIDLYTALGDTTKAATLRDLLGEAPAQGSD